MLNKTLKRKWVAALRSGKYTQGHGRLVTVMRRNKQYCCLGVLADVAPDKILPLDLAYLDDNCGIPISKQLKLAGYNDGREVFGKTPKTFKWIASHIERSKTI